MMNSYSKPRVRVVGATANLLRGGGGFFMDFGGQYQIA